MPMCMMLGSFERKNEVIGHTRINDKNSLRMYRLTECRQATEGAGAAQFNCVVLVACTTLPCLSLHSGHKSTG
jgi:hypothetical protein